jgi:two-component sensor histidine kinase
MDPAQTNKLLRQQAAIAAFGSFALRETDLLTILTEAARACAEGLSVPFCKVCRYRSAENDLLIEAGYGWDAGVVGNVVSRADESSPQGRAFITGLPSICRHLQDDAGYVLPPFYAAHGIISTIDVVIKGTDPTFGMPDRDSLKQQRDVQPYGVLEIDNDEQHDYDQHDIDFLTGFANVLAAAVSTAARTSMLQSTVDRMRVLVAEKDRLLDQKKVMAAELQHRVRNNLQLIYGMLNRQLEDTTEKASRKGIQSVALRVTTLAQVYDHLLGSEMASTTDFGSYAKALCESLASINAVSADAVTLTCDAEAVILDLDTVTALGIVVAEAITNCYEHAFQGGSGSIQVSVRYDPGATATMIISDDGPGFEPGTENKRQGIGLIRRLVEQVRGTATISSDHRGTVWTIRFPAVRPEEMPVAAR